MVKRWVFSGIHTSTGETAKPIFYSLAGYLHARNYTEAPVTVDNSEWIFAAAYDSVLRT
jgi:hypothetical protein